MQQTTPSEGIHTPYGDTQNPQSTPQRLKKRTLGAADLVVFFVGVILGRTHLLFGTYPFGVAFVACLPHHVFLGLAGAVVGALTRGKTGILFAMISFITLFVRIIISGAEKRTEEGGMFRENLTLRMSSGMIGGFVSAVYELLLRGITVESVLFSLTMILGTGLASILFGLLFSYPVTLTGVLFHSSGILKREKEGRMRRKRTLFFISAVTYLLVLSYGLSKIELLSVSLGGVFVFFVTLFVAKRFGAVRASVVGFVGGLVLSPELAVACAITGASSGLLFPYGNLWGELGAVFLSALWGLYTGELSGMLSILPEALIGALLAHPLLIKAPSELDTESTPQASAEESAATEMMQAMCTRVVKQASENGAAVRIGDSFLSLSALLLRAEEKGALPSAEDYRELLENAMLTRCKTCSYFDTCDRASTGFYRCASSLLSQLSSHRAPDADDVGKCADSARTDEFLRALRASVARMEEDRFQSARQSPIAEVMRTVGEMVKEGQTRQSEDASENSELSARVTEAFHAVGFPLGVARVIGTARPRILLCARDDDGTRITSREVTEAIEKACEGFVLGQPSYYRREQLVLADIPVRRRYSVKCAGASLCHGEDGICGDVIQTFEGRDGVFYGMISDGTGTGASARKSARFVADFVQGTLDAGASAASVLRLLDEVVRRKAPEATATLDLFSLDLVLGGGAFYKLGAVTSFIKRGESLFSIRAKSLPLGLSDSSFLGERISAGIEAGDTVILLSDGICQDPDHTPWLLELLARSELRDPKALAQSVLDRAKKEHGVRDDMSCMVCRIDVA